MITKMFENYNFPKFVRNSDEVGVFSYYDQDYDVPYYDYEKSGLKIPSLWEIEHGSDLLQDLWDYYYFHVEGMTFKIMAQNLRDAKTKLYNKYGIVIEEVS